MGGGILYVADIVYDPSLAADIARVFARRFRDTGASFVATIETKGIPLAFLTAHYMGIPLAVVRRRHLHRKNAADVPLKESGHPGQPCRYHR